MNSAEMCASSARGDESRIAGPVFAAPLGIEPEARHVRQLAAIRSDQRRVGDRGHLPQQFAQFESLLLPAPGQHVDERKSRPPKVPFDLLNDFEPVALLANNPSVIVSKKDVPARDLKELIAWVKANRDKVLVGTSGVGAATHLGGILFENLTDTRVQFVPFRGAGPAMQALVAGQIDLVFDQLSNSLPQLQAGTIKSYAVMAETRAIAAPDIPTVDEAGLTKLYLPVWNGMWAPKGTPKDIIRKLNKAVVESLADTTVRQRLADIGQQIYPREQQSPEALGAYQKAEIEKWWPIVKAAGIKAD